MKTTTKIQNLFLKSFIFALLIVFSACEKESLSENVNAVDASAKSSPAAQQGELTIAEIVIANATAEEDPQFTYLLKALVATDLAGVFAGEDNYTVFAPTDDAFIAALGEDFDFDNIDDDTKAFLTNVLLYHVTDGRRFSNSVLGKKNPKKIEMLNEAMIYVNSGGGIDTNDEGMEVNASIILPEEDDDEKLFDIAATNGVIHVIDAVLLPAE